MWRFIINIDAMQGGVLHDVGCDAFLDTCDVWMCVDVWVTLKENALRCVAPEVSDGILAVTAARHHHQFTAAALIRTAAVCKMTWHVTFKQRLDDMYMTHDLIEAFNVYVCVRASLLWKKINLVNELRWQGLCLWTPRATRVEHQDKQVKFLRRRTGKDYFVAFCGPCRRWPAACGPSRPARWCSSDCTPALPDRTFWGWPRCGCWCCAWPSRWRAASRPRSPRERRASRDRPRILESNRTGTPTSPYEAMKKENTKRRLLLHHNSCRIKNVTDITLHCAHSTDNTALNSVEDAFCSVKVRISIRKSFDFLEMSRENGVEKMRRMSGAWLSVTYVRQLLIVDIPFEHIGHWLFSAKIYETKAKNGQRKRSENWFESVVRGRENEWVMYGDEVKD